MKLPINPNFTDAILGHHLLGVLKTVTAAVERVQYLRLKTELTEQTNPEVNTDRQVLISRMEALGFRREIVEALEDVDRKLFAAGTNLDFKGCIDLVRTTFEEIVEDAAKKAAAITGTKLPDPNNRRLGDFQPWKDLLATTKVLTIEEADLFQKFYNHLSNVGTHRLGSSQEHVRVARNTTIEWGMLLVGRVQSLGAPSLQR